MRVARWLVAVLWVVAIGACETAPPAADSGPAGSDGGACGGRCDDGLYCNGVERCAPDDPDADENGCVAADRGPCTGECDEAADACRTTCTTDDDGDSAIAISCGGDDCDDHDASRAPGNVEVCDGAALDEDCDPCTVGLSDSDVDGYTANTCANRYFGASPSCGADVRVGPGMVVGADCNDFAAGVSPDDGEIPCTTVDEDCDGATDEGPRTSWWPDLDGDTYGDADPSVVPVMDCTRPPNHSPNNLDCNDMLAAVNPARGEICNGFDDNCVDGIDEGFGTTTYYRDADGDGWGIASMTTTSCLATAPTGWAPDRAGVWDCDDGAPTVFPGATESCNAIDDNCNGAADYVISGYGTEDDDGDGYPDARCPGGTGNDCDDSVGRGDVHPGATEHCDGRDNDCDGTTDVSSTATAECAASPNVLATGAACSAGSCTATCAPGYASCDGTLTPSNGCEITLATDPMHCGACGHACGAGLACVAGACAPPGGLQRISTYSMYPSAGFTCAIRGGSASCWGAHQMRATSLALTGATEVRGRIVIAGGAAYRIADRTDGTFVATGAATGVVHAAELDASTVYAITTGGSVVRVVAGSGTTTLTNVVGAIQIAVAESRACALLETGARVCWSDHSSATPALTTTAGPFVWLAESTCAVAAAGSIDCTGTSASSVIAGFGSAVQGAQIPSGHGCVVAPTGTVRCAGQNASGQLGDGTTTAASTPVAVSGLTDAIQVAVGASSAGTWSCALRRLPDGSEPVSCWGAALLAGSGTSPVRATAVTPPLTGLTAITNQGVFFAGGVGYQFTAGSATPMDATGRTGVGWAIDYTTCVRTTAGGVECRGSDEYGQLGNGDPTAYSSSYVSTGLGGVSDLVGTYWGARAALSGTNVYRWGIRMYGAGSASPGYYATSPELFVGGAAQLAAGPDKACIRRTDGTIACWGAYMADTTGYITSSVTTPTTIAGITGATDLALHGGMGGLVVRGGQVWSWGGDWGQLNGDGPGTSAYWLAVPGLAADRVWTGYATACARRSSDGRIVCWGDNAGGQVGDGSIVARDVPTLASALPAGLSVTQVAIMNDGTCALLTDGTARCWGTGDFGVPHTRFYTTPITVVGP